MVGSNLKYILDICRKVKGSVDVIRYVLNADEEKELAFQIGRLSQFIESTILDLSPDEYKDIK